MLAAGALVIASCGGGDGGAPATSVRSAGGPATTEATTTVVEAPAASTTSTSVVTVVPPTVPPTVPRVEAPPVTVPAVTVPALPPLVTTLVPTTTTTESPLPVPELFDAVQGIGTPCVATADRPDGCFFFVYATLATRTATHHVYSDVATSPWQARDHGHDCGSEANPHHREREGCSFYFGPVHGRTAGQRECFWATTVAGGRESARSNTVCLTWADEPPRTTSAP